VNGREVASHREVLSTSRIPKADCTCLVVADRWVALAVRQTALPSQKVQARDSKTPAGTRAHALGRRRRLIWSVAGQHEREFLRPSRVSGGGSEEMLTGSR